MNAAKRQQIFKRLRDANPAPTTELKHGNTFQLLVSVMLSAQATDRSVNLVTRELFKVIKKPQDVLDMGLRKFRTRIKSIGLFNTKAANIIKTARILRKHHRSRVPKTRPALEALPGVGRKTANVMLNTAFAQPVIAVDTHIFRVANRTGLAPGKTVRQVEDRLMQVIDDEFKADAHHWLILHGRYTCISRRPHCGHCLIFNLCGYSDKVTS